MNSVSSPDDDFAFFKYKCGGNAGIPILKKKNTESLSLGQPNSRIPSSKKDNSSDGKKTISNGLSRTHCFLTDQEKAQGRSTRWTELEIHGGVKSISNQVFEMRFLTALFVSNNQLTRVTPQIARLVNLSILDLSYNKLRSLPAEMGDMVSLTHLFLNSNQIRVLPYELGKLFRLQTFLLAHNPLSPELSKIYQDLNGDKKLLQHLLDNLSVNTPPPPERQWITMKLNDPETPTATFTILNYNVLCDKYATSTLYSYCPQWALNWDYRKHSIVKELRQYESDILTLQEVETEQYRQFFLPKLESIGYSGMFYPKSRSKTMNEEDKKFVDGCAIFWKSNKFELERHDLIEFTKVAMENAQAHENMLNRVHPRDNIALTAVLRIRDAVYSTTSVMNSYKENRLPSPNESVVGSVVVICTAHIHWDPEFCDVKLIQSMMLVHEMEKLLGKLSNQYHILKEQIPVLICGDFNSLPDSGVFEFLSKGAISKDHPDLKSFREDSCLSCLSANKNDAQNFTHSLRLDSAIDTSHMPYTNYTMDFKGMIDYIFATPQSLSRHGILGPLEPNWIYANKFVGFPQPHVPSDHIPIMAQYSIIPVSRQKNPHPIQHFGSSHSSQFGAIGR